MRVPEHKRRFMTAVLGSERLAELDAEPEAVAEARRQRATRGRRKEADDDPVSEYLDDLLRGRIIR